MKIIDGKPEYSGALVSVAIMDQLIYCNLVMAVSQSHFSIFLNMLFLPHQDVFTKAVRQEGIFSLWKGFTPYYARIGPHTVFTFIFLEQLRALYWRYYRE